jgi:hypothetical protein
MDEATTKALGFLLDKIDVMMRRQNGIIAGLSAKDAGFAPKNRIDRTAFDVMQEFRSLSATHAELRAVLDARPRVAGRQRSPRS